MLDIILWSIILIASLIVLVKAADFFNISAEKIGIHFGMSPFIVGVTLVAIGTSLPELVTSIIAVLKGSSEMVIGTVVGANIANILFVLGITAIIGKKLNVAYELIHVDLPLFIGTALLLAVTVWDGFFTFFDAILCLAALLVYLRYTYVSERHVDPEIKKEMKGEMKKKYLSKTTWVIMAVSAFMIYVGAKFTVESVIQISEILQVGTEIIAVSAVAIGTTLPELTVTIAAARKGKAEIAVGNILGSSIFNSMAVTGIAGLFGTLVIPASILTFSLPLMIIASVMYLLITQDKQITKWEGMFLLIFYAFFIGKVVGAI